MSDTDLELLARYTRHNAEDAFAEIVRRHRGLVYSAALRQVHSPQLAAVPVGLAVTISSAAALAAKAVQISIGAVLDVLVGKGRCPSQEVLPGKDRLWSIVSMRVAWIKANSSYRLHDEGPGSDSD